MPLNPLRIVARFPQPVRLLLVGTLVNKLGTFIVPYLTLVLLRDFHMREGEAARLLFAYGCRATVLDHRRRVTMPACNPSVSCCLYPGRASTA